MSFNAICKNFRIRVYVADIKNRQHFQDKKIVAIENVNF